MIEAPYPTLDEMLLMIGEAGRRMAEIDASEGAAGNISVCMRWPVELRKHFPLVNDIQLPLAVPGLAGSTVLVTGSGRRLREIIDEPTANLAAVTVDEGGKTGKIYTSPLCRFERPTSEFNSHLAVHEDQLRISGSNFLTVIHAQPIYITFLSQIPRYQDTTFFSQRLLRWEPESIANFPNGIGFMPFCVPGTPELMQGNIELLRKHNLVMWAKHGVMTFSEKSVKHAADRIEYAETGARYEYLNLAAGEPAAGLSAEEIRQICKVQHIDQNIF
ncbi:MAG: rhamnulose-phosphate aldolase [Chloroflexota bacterium]|nr:rhamnulose-phosphate aldolase [Chloroflexota bacterium]